MARPHGLRGEVVVEVLSDFPERFVPGLGVTLRGAGARDGDERHARIAASRPHGTRLLVLFEGVEDAASAEALRGLDLCVHAADAPPRPDGYVFHHEVAGCEAVDAAGRALGVVRDLVDMGGRPLLTLDTPRGERDVPFTRPIVVSIDLAARRIVLDPPEGLLD